MKIPARINENKKLVYDRSLVTTFLQGQKPNTWIDISFDKKKPRNSDAQRGYYFGRVLPQITEGLGYEPQDKAEDQLHFNFKCVFFKIKPDKHGVYKDVPHVFDKGKSKLDVSEKNKFIDWVKRRVSEYVYVED